MVSTCFRITWHISTGGLTYCSQVFENVHEKRVRGRMILHHNNVRAQTVARTNVYLHPQNMK